MYKTLLKRKIQESETQQKMTANWETPSNNTNKENNKPLCPDTKQQEAKEFTEIIGSCGLWQIWILILVILAGVPVAWNHLVNSFFTLPLDHWCAMPNNVSLSQAEWLRTSIPNKSVNDEVVHSHCEMFRVFENSSLDKDTLTSCVEWDYESDYTTINKQWDLVCDRDWMTSMSQSVYMGGFLVAVLLSGQLADTYGRHPIIMMNVFITIIFGTAAALSSSFLVFTIMRFFVAMGQSGISLTLFVLLIELVGHEYRAPFGLMQEFGWHIGYCLLPLLAWYVPTWHHLQLAISLPCIACLAFFWILPESPRWLLANGKLDKAIRVLEKAAKFNGKDVPNLEVQVKKICSAIDEGESKKATGTFLDLLKTSNLRKRTLNLYFTWMVISFVYYGLSLNTGQLGGDYHLNFFLSGIVEIPATLLCIVAMRRFGNKGPFIFTLVSGGVACIGCIFIPKSMQWFLVTFAMIGKLMVSSSFCIVYVYTAELFPTVTRNIGVGSSSTMARIGSMVAPFMKDLGNVTNPAVPMALFGILSLCSAGFSWFLPETKGLPVPETLAQAEEFGINKAKPKDLIEMTDQ